MTAREGKKHESAYLQSVSVLWTGRPFKWGRGLHPPPDPVAEGVAQQQLGVALQELGARLQLREKLLLEAVVHQLALGPQVSLCRAGPAVLRWRGADIGSRFRWAGGLIAFHY